MKKFTFLFAALMACTAMFAEAKVPTNEQLWGVDTADVNGFMHYVNHYHNIKKATQPMDNVGGFLYIPATYGVTDPTLQIMTNEDSDWKWLGDYILSVATAQDVTITSDANWRWQLHAFFNCTDGTVTGNQKAAAANFTEAGKPENWGPAYLKANPEGWPEGPSTAVENNVVAVKAQKIIRNGQVYMVRDGKTYNMMGVEVK